MSTFLDSFEEWYETAAASWRNLKAGAPHPKPNQQTQSVSPAREPERRDNNRGFVLPGYKYLGPGNGLDKGPPVNKADSVALGHDKAYDQQLKAGDNPYIKFNHADQDFIDSLQDDQSFGGNLGKAVFQAKKRILEPFGLVEDPVNTAPAKKNTGKLTNHYPVVKKPKLTEEVSAGGGSSAVQDGGATAEGTEPVAASEMAEGGGGALGDASGGADGVGNASGNWHCDSQWMGNTVITKTTRTWVLPSYNNHIYKAITSGTSQDANVQYAGYSTPWGYFGFNRFHCHFSPRDWQRLINNHWGIRPKSLKFKIFNVQVKEVTTQDQTKTIANNLTSTIQVFTDDEHQLPYVLGSATEGTMPPFPSDVYALPQYGYCTMHTNQNGARFNDRSAFYCLEYFPSQMLRTGNNFEFTFDFEEVPFHSMFAHSQDLDRLMNPLVDQYLWNFNGVDSSRNAQFKKAVKGAYGTMGRNWLPGPKFLDQRVRAYTGGTDNYANWNIWSNGNKVNLKDRQYLLQPGPVSATHTKAEASSIPAQNILGLAKDPYRSGSTTAGISDVMVTDEQEVAPTNGVGWKPYGKTVTNEQNTTTAPTSSDLDVLGALPGMVWQDRDIYLQGPIWAKIPKTDGKFHPSPNLGGFGLHNPPPQVSIKNTPVPADPPVEYVHQKRNSYITQYSTGQCTVEMVWELRKENSKRWNPEIQFTSNFSDRTSIMFAPNETGGYIEDRLIGTRYLTQNL
uniref:Capsid protein n=1 Tax=Ostrich parvovirus TaxID=2699166 RepID=A0AAT9JYN8_9VIRU